MHNNFSRRDLSRMRQFGYLDFFMEGMTEDEFIEEYDAVKRFYSTDIDHSILQFSGVPTGDQISTKMPEILHDIYISNPKKNAWADRPNWSERLRAFLILRGEEL